MQVGTPDSICEYLKHTISIVVDLRDKGIVWEKRNRFTRENRKTREIAIRCSEWKHWGKRGENQALNLKHLCEVEVLFSSFEHETNRPIWQEWIPLWIQSHRPRPLPRILPNMRARKHSTWTPQLPWRQIPNSKRNHQAQFRLNSWRKVKHEAYLNTSSAVLLIDLTGIWGKDVQGWSQGCLWK